MIIGFIIGLVVGSMFGVFTMAILIAGDERRKP
ncbi:MAG: DUF3789 domain-containing protein [Prevotella sp.]|nr:DUF3789 domain-containing protein [Prevotella sp.]